MRVGVVLLAHRLFLVLPYSFLSAKGNFSFTFLSRDQYLPSSLAPDFPHPLLWGCLPQLKSASLVATNTASRGCTRGRKGWTHQAPEISRFLPGGRFAPGTKAIFSRGNTQCYDNRPLTNDIKVIQIYHERQIEESREEATRFIFILAPRSSQRPEDFHHR